MFIRRFKQRVEQLRREPEHVRMRAAVRWTAFSGGGLALLWVSVLLPLQVGSLFTNKQEATDAGVVRGIQDPAPSVTPSPTAKPQLYQGTRPTQRQPASLTPYDELTTPTPLPTAMQ